MLHPVWTVLVLDGEGHAAHGWDFGSVRDATDFVSRSVATACRPRSFRVLRREDWDKELFTRALASANSVT